MDNNAYKPPEADLEPQLSKQPAFYVVSPRKFTWLYLGTFGAYALYWFYENWSCVRRYYGNNIWPVPRALFSIFFTHSLIGEIEHKLHAAGRTHEWYPGLLAATLVALQVLGHVLDRLSAKGVGSPVTDIVSFVTMPLLYLGFLKVQRAINVAEDDIGGTQNDHITSANIAWLLLGGLVWILVLAGLYDVLIGLPFGEAGAE